MNNVAYRYRFRPDIDLKEAQDTLLLAVVAAEGIFGQARVRMDADYHLDPTINVIIVDADTVVGQVVNQVFTAFISREFGRGRFLVRRVELVAQGGAA